MADMHAALHDISSRRPTDATVAASAPAGHAVSVVAFSAEPLSARLPAGLADQPRDAQALASVQWLCVCPDALQAGIAFRSRQSAVRWRCSCLSGTQNIQERLT